MNYDDEMINRIINALIPPTDFASGTKIAAGPGGQLDNVMRPQAHQRYEEAVPGDTMRVPSKMPVKEVEEKKAPVSTSDREYMIRNAQRLWDESYQLFKKNRPDLKPHEIIKAMNKGPRPADPAPVVEEPEEAPAITPQEAPGRFKGILDYIKEKTKGK